MADPELSKDSPGNPHQDIKETVIADSEVNKSEQETISNSEQQGQIEVKPDESIQGNSPTTTRPDPGQPTSNAEPEKQISSATVDTTSSTNQPEQAPDGGVVDDKQGTTATFDEGTDPEQEEQREPFVPKLKSKITKDDVLRFIQDSKEIMNSDEPPRFFLQPSKSACRFELPADLMSLETMNPFQYFMDFCYVDSIRTRLYETAYERVHVAESPDDELTVDMLQKAFVELFGSEPPDEQLDLLKKLIRLPEDAEHIDKTLFMKLAAFMERIISSEDKEQRATALERIDFSALDMKLNGVDVPEDLQELLYFIANSS